MNISFFCKMWRETDHVKTILTEIFSVNYSGFQFSKMKNKVNFRL
ncbi:hypothetical protein UMN179_00505 [Gallibacterium anatis UMN179]|uniref:Uncharacterized protein n=1 Tax=Gallibacterium anatis (strain UMN179) TaxID=1005058 RepID=F4HCJ4_GALAU|nr:hypothetical protein UMN179_00505 [Gallibacterium anatis UMN179]